MKLFDDSLATQRIHIEAACGCVQNEKGYHRDWAVERLQTSVEAREGLQQHVNTLVAEFIATSREKVQGVVQIEIHVAEKVTTDKIMDLFLIDRM